MQRLLGILSALNRRVYAAFNSTDRSTEKESFTAQTEVQKKKVSLFLSATVYIDYHKCKRLPKHKIVKTKKIVFPHEDVESGRDNKNEWMKNLMNKNL